MKDIDVEKPDVETRTESVSEQPLFPQLLTDINRAVKASERHYFVRALGRSLLVTGFHAAHEFSSRVKEDLRRAKS